MSFKDHFSKQAVDYKNYRPTYPKELFDFILGQVKNRQLAWDCATGNGQAAKDIAPYFDRVIATDASEKQISNATPIVKVDFRVAPAEASGLDDNSVDLIMVAQALHWFNHDLFWEEVKRVAKPGALLAIWTYQAQSITPEIDDPVNHLYGEILEDFWPPERHHVEASYTTIPFPFQEIETPQLTITKEINLDGLIGYLSSWSATQRYIKQHNQNPIELIIDDLEKAWGDPETTRIISWPMPTKFAFV